MSTNRESREAVREAAGYLRSCGISLPRYSLTTEVLRFRLPGNSWFREKDSGLQLNMGRYPNQFARNWFAMHELGHLLWIHHQPLRWKRFRMAFGAPEPENYQRLTYTQSWKTTGARKLSWNPGSLRPKGEPSWYGARGGGEERFCEMIGLMWAHGDFSMDPPDDLEALWDTCWNHGLSRMT